MPWVEPLLDFFDWKKRVITVVFALVVFGWSFVNGLPWPVIIVIAFAMMVVSAYALVLPGLVRLVNVGYQAAPNTGIWRHKKKFLLCQGACLLANTVPVYLESEMSPDAHAWLVQFYDAVNSKEIEFVHSADDNRDHYFGGSYHPHTRTEITKETLIKFCRVRDRNPEFLADA